MMFKHLLLAASCFAACFMHAANAQVPALYGATDVFSWYRLQALGNTVSLGPDQIKQINAGSYATYPDAVSGDLKAVTRAKVPIGNANLVVDVVAKIPAASVAKAVANFAVKVIAPVQIGIAVYDLIKELNYVKMPDGSLAKPKPGSCTVAPCNARYGFPATSVSSYMTGRSTVVTIPYTYSTPYEACWAFVRAADGIWPYAEGYPKVEDRGLSCGIALHWDSGYSNMTPKAVTPDPTSTPETIPATRQELEDAIASKSGWPSSSAIARATMDAIRSGESVDVVPQTVTGPSSSPGTMTSTTTSGSAAVAPTSGTSTSPATAGSPAVDSITTTSTTTNNYTYEGNKVSVTNTTVTNITNNTTGQQQTTKTDKAPEIKNADLKPDKPATPDKVEDPATDTPLGDVPKLYTPVYPRGIEGVWSDAKSAMSGTSLARIIPSLMPSVGSSGQCPTMPINLNLSNWANFGTVDVAPPCFLWDFGKVVIIMSALLLARGLVFGG